MSRSLGFQQQHYAGGGTWTEARAQQGYAFQEESSWSSENSYQSRFPGMNMNHLGGFGMDTELSMSKLQNRGMLGGLNMTKLGGFATDSDDLSMSRHHGKLGGMQMNRFGGFDVDSDLSMSKHGKRGGMHMSTGSMQGMNRHGEFGMDSELYMSKLQRGKVGGISMNKLVGSAMDSELSMSKHQGMNMNRLGGSAMDSERSISKHRGKFGGSHGMSQEGMHSDHGFVKVHRGVRKSPFGGNNASYHALNGGGGGAKFSYGGHNEYFSEESEYEEDYEEEHVGAVTNNLEEMRYHIIIWVGILAT
ncbi:hypothetical protein Fmac_013947 [Flemingia macrophylla]|uniref:Uncharacterized protein n=1 Tax=Flemingia macrophylla TaxID=520843 RepID=A0ABD1MAD8_9FABA